VSQAIASPPGQPPASGGPGRPGELRPGQGKLPCSQGPDDSL